jgi:hypothetical protein
MFGLLLVVTLAAALYMMARKVSPAGTNVLVVLVMAGYVTRLLLSLFLREVPLFSHGVGGDSSIYETEAQIIAKMWSFGHIHYVTVDEFPELGRTTFPPNLFALIAYLNEGDSRLGATATVAFVACLSCLNIASLALESGASRRAAITVLATLLFLPSFLFYTSDMYKDGIVQFCVVGVGAAALRLSRRFSLNQLLVALLCLAVLAGTRFYLVYATIVPLGLGALGLRSQSPLRTFMSIVALTLGVVVFIGLTSRVDTVLDDARTAYELGTSRGVRDAGAQGGSGVELQGSPLAVFPLALAYTLFAPFFWQSGSLGFQLGKIDGVVWYVIAVFAAKGAVRLSRTNRSELLVLLSFIVPTTFAYAASFSNIGLTVRERLGVVMMCALLAAMGTSAVRADEPQAVAVGPAGRLSPRLGR